MADTPDYNEILEILRAAANKSDLITNKYHDVLVYDEESDIDLGDGEFTPSLSKRVKQFVTSAGGTASGFKKVIRSLTDNTTFSQRDSGTISHNLNAVGGLDVTLPKAEAGLFFEFRCLKAANLTINTNASDSYYDTGLKTKLTNTVGAHLKIFAITDTQWFVETITGTWS